MLRPKEGSFDADGLIKKIETGYTKNKPQSDFVKKKSFAPSSLVWGNGACARYWYIAFNGAQFEWSYDPYSQANMRNGTLAHGRIQDAMKESGILAEVELKLISEDPPIFGFMDALLEYKNEHFPTEIKTMKEESFQYRKAAGLPAPYHVEQILIYMKMLKKKRGVLIYESKNTHELLVFLVEMNDEYEAWVTELFEWMRTVRKAWQDKQLPIKNYRSNSKVCKGCPVQKICSEMPKGDIKIPNKRPIE